MRTASDIQRQIDRLPGGGHVQLEAGVYVLDRQIKTPDRIRLQGAGQGRTILLMQPDKSGANIQGLWVVGRGVEIRGLTVDGNRLQQPGSSSRNIVVFKGASCLIEDVDSVNASLVGIKVWEAEAWVRRVRVLGNGVHGLNVYCATGKKARVVVEDLVAEDNLDHGIDVNAKGGIAEVSMTRLSLRNNGRAMKLRGARGAFRKVFAQGNRWYNIRSHGDNYKVDFEDLTLVGGAVGLRLVHDGNYSVRRAQILNAEMGMKLHIPKGRTLSLEDIQVVSHQLSLVADGAGRLEYENLELVSKGGPSLSVKGIQMTPKVAQKKSA